jgi:hypothetical protein
MRPSDRRAPCYSGLDSGSGSTPSYNVSYSVFYARRAGEIVTGKECRVRSGVSGWIVCVLALGLVLWTGLNAGRADEPSVRAALERQRVREGESVLYRITITNIDSAPRPDVPAQEGLDVIPQGESTENRIVIINNRRVESRGRVFDYLLTPQRTGRFTIPAPRVEVDGREIVGDALSLQVVEIAEQDLAILELKAEPAEVYPLQPFTVTLTVAIKQLPPPLDDEDPVALLRDPPRMSIPWADDGQLAAGLESDIPWQRWLGAWQHPRGAGFRINGIRSASLFSLFDDSSGMGFLPTPRRIQRAGDAGKSVDYWEYAFPRTFTARQVGEYSFGPVRLEGRLAAGLTGGRTLQGEEVYALARAVTVRVKDVPAAGRPPTYIDAVGTFDVTAALAPQQAKVGDPLTLTLTLTGRGTLDTAMAPDLNQVTGVADNFRIYEATSQTRDESKEFVYSLRPLNDSIREFPPIAVSYFDVNRRQYVTLQTDGLPLEVLPADRLSSADITAGRSGALGGAIETRREGLFANITDLSAVRNDQVAPGRWLLGLAGFGGFSILALAVARTVCGRARDAELQRRRNAAPLARQQLQTADSHLDAGRVRQAADAVSAAVVGLIATACDRDAAGMTTDDTGVRLRELGVDDALSKQLLALLEACDAARYGGTLPADDLLKTRAKPLLEELIVALKQKKYLA